MPTFDHIARQVDHVPSAVAWYQTQFPTCTLRYQDETWALLEVQGVKLAFVTRGAHPDHVAWRVSATELQALADAHQQPIATHRDRTRGIYVCDPAGHWVEFIHYPHDA